MDQLMYLTVLILISQAMSIHDRTEETLIINTSSGPIRGLKRKYVGTGDDLYEFRGIPYAKPPIGARRFKKPEAVEKWTNILDATSYGNLCPQNYFKNMPNASNMVVSEDCLVLNVYVPKVLSTDKTLSVMVWIHGGGFAIGHGHQFNGDRISIEGNVVVVTINYRLNIFGFLSVNHPAALGNYGLWDQKLALQWIHDNIADFGGNPESVTIFGESAGGWSVSYLSLIPSNKGLFQNVIAQSGVVSRTAMARSSSIEKNINNIANFTDCPITNLYKFVDCLREKSVDDLLLATSKSFTSYNHLLYDLVHQPVIDNDLFTDHPIRRLEDKMSEESKFFGSLNFMTGTTSHEGSLLYMLIPPSTQSYYDFKVKEEIPTKFVREGLVEPFVKEFYKNNENVKDRMSKFYSVEGSSVDQSMKAVDFFTDAVFLYPAVSMLQYHSSLGGNSYQYYIKKISPLPIGPPPPVWFTGCGHGDELLYLFDIDTMFNTGECTFSKEEKELSKNLIRYWTSFAKNR